MPLAEGTLHYLRTRQKGAVFGDSPYSPTVSFTTKITTKMPPTESTDSGTYAKMQSIVPPFPEENAMFSHNSVLSGDGLVLYIIGDVGGSKVLYMYRMGTGSFYLAESVVLENQNIPEKLMTDFAGTYVAIHYNASLSPGGEVFNNDADQWNIDMIFGAGYLQIFRYRYGSLEFLCNVISPTPLAFENYGTYSSFSGDGNTIVVLGGTKRLNGDVYTPTIDIFKRNWETHIFEIATRTNWHESITNEPMFVGPAFVSVNHDASYIAFVNSAEKATATIPDYGETTIYKHRAAVYTTDETGAILNGIISFDQPSLSYGDAKIGINDAGDVLYYSNPFNGVNYEGPGYVYVARRIGVDWSTSSVIQIACPDTTNILNFGIYVSMSDDGSRLMVANTHLFEEEGQYPTEARNVYVFEFENGEYVYKQRIASPSKNRLDGFGEYGILADKDLNIAYISSPYASYKNVASAGLGFVYFHRNPLQDYYYYPGDRFQDKEAPTDAYFRNFDVSPDGKYLVIGYQNDGDVLAGQGSVSLFKRTDGVYIKTHVFLPPGPAGSKMAFGRNVAVNETGTVVVAMYTDAATSKIGITCFVQFGNTYISKDMVYPTLQTSGGEGFFTETMELTSSGSDLLVGYVEKAPVSEGSQDLHITLSKVQRYRRGGSSWDDWSSIFEVEIADYPYTGEVGLKKIKVDRDRSNLYLACNKATIAGNLKAGCVALHDSRDGGFGLHQTITESDSAPNGFFGSTLDVSTDNSTIAVGKAPQNGSADAVYVFRRVNNLFVEISKIISREAGSTSFGRGLIKLSSDGYDLFISDTQVLGESLTVTRIVHYRYDGSSYVFVMNLNNPIEQNGAGYGQTILMTDDKKTLFTEPHFNSEAIKSDDITLGSIWRYEGV